MTPREELVDLITSTAVAALDWHWAARPPHVLSPEDCFRHVAEAIADAVKPVITESERRGGEVSLRAAADVLYSDRGPGHPLSVATWLRELADEMGRR